MRPAFIVFAMLLTGGTAALARARAQELSSRPAGDAAIAGSATPATQPAPPAASQAGAAAPSSQPAGSAPPSSQPIDQPPSRGPWFALEEMTADLGFDGEFHRRFSASDTRGYIPRRYRVTNEAQRYRETLGLSAQGWAVDPRVLDFDLSGRAGFSQESYFENRPGPDQSSSPSGDWLQYDARATLFPAGRISANVFAERNDDRVPRMFLPSLDRRRERYGAELIFNDRELPMRLSYEDLDEQLTSPYGSWAQRTFGRDLYGEDDERWSDRRLGYEATWHASEQHELRLDYEYDDRREQYSGTDRRFDTTRNDLTLNDVVQFGADRRSRLETLARFQDETGDLARDTFELAPQLRLQHTDDLATTYRGQLLKDAFQGNDLTLFRGEAGAEYRFSDALSGSAGLWGLAQQVERGRDLDEWGALGTLAYDRPNAWGRLGGNLTYNHVQQRTPGDARDGVVIAEAITLRDPLPVILAHADVRRWSILVRDLDRRRVFVAGRDYVILPAGRYTAIARLPTGRIADRESVLVSYTYRTGQGYELGRDRVDLRVQQEFTGGLTPYYAGSVQDEDVDRTRFLQFDVRDVNRHRLGLRYRKPRWGASAEYEYNDDSIDPFHALHASADAAILQKPSQVLSAQGTFSYYRFSGADWLRRREASLLDLGLSYNATLTDQLALSATAAYRYEDDSIDGLTHGVDLSASLDWHIGLFTASLEIEYDALSVAGSNDDNVTAWVKLRREIPILAREGR